ncbi:hypothetical protein BDR26DRAFT_917034, partial [Obelidium mucronatum]
MDLDVTQISYTAIPVLTQCRPYRMNLVAISSGVLCICVVDTIICFAPPGVGIYALATENRMEPFTLIKPPRAEGHPSTTINAIKSGFLGTTPILATVNDGGQVVVHFTEHLKTGSSGQPPIILRQPKSQSTWGIAIQSEFHLLAVSANSHTVTVYDLGVHSTNDNNTSNHNYPLGGPTILQRELIDHENNIPNIEFSKCGKFLASVSIDSSCRLWRLDTGECIAYVKTTGAPFRSRGNSEEWNWSVNFIDPRSFTKGSLISTAHMTQPEWSPGVPECLKSPRRRTAQDLSTTIVYESSDGEETVYSFGDQSDDGDDINEKIHDVDSDDDDEDDIFVDAALESAEPIQDDEILSRQTSFFSFREGNEEMNSVAGGDEVWETGDGMGTPPTEIPEHLYFEEENEYESETEEPHLILGDVGEYVDAREESDDDNSWIDEDDDGNNADSADESIDSDSLWQRPSVPQKTLEFKVTNSDLVAGLEGQWVFYASLTDLWIVDFATNEKVCGLENVFEEIDFNHYEMFNRISIHEYIEELGLIVALTQAGAVALIKLVQIQTPENTSSFQMITWKIIKPVIVIPFVGMTIEKRRNISPGSKLILELSIFAYDSTVSVYCIQPQSCNHLSVDKLIL